METTIIYCVPFFLLLYLFYAVFSAMDGPMRDMIAFLASMHLLLLLVNLARNMVS